MRAKAPQPRRLARGRLPRGLAELSARVVGDGARAIAHLGAQVPEELRHLPAGMRLHALAVAGSRPRLALAVGPADLEPGAPGEGGCDLVARVDPGAGGLHVAKLLGDVDELAGVIAVQELVIHVVAARPPAVSIGALDLRVADRDQGAAPLRHVVDPHVDPARVPPAGGEGVDGVPPRAPADPGRGAPRP